MSYYRVRHDEDLTPIWIIIALNVLVWIITSFSDSIFSQFALFSSRVGAAPWTIITAMFTHAQFPNFWHIVLNMLTLFFFGRFVMNLLGTGWMLFIYLLGGIMGNLVFILLAPNGAAVGASGAVYALGGALLVLRPNTKVMILPIPIPMPLWVAILIGMVIILPNVAWQAHLGGLAFGAAAAFFLRKRARMVIF